MVDLHRHDEYSTFDGFGKATELAKLAKELGHTSLGTSNHGNTNGLVQTYLACKENDIKPILGVEGYFLPKYKEQSRGYHLCIFAKDLQGYRNLNRLMYEGEKKKYYNPIFTFEDLEKYHEGLICTSACVAGYLSQCIIKGKIDQARAYLNKMVEIFGEDFYVEIQPYRVSEKGIQEDVNVKSIKLAKELGIKCILTSDSHRGKKEDFGTYMKMHEIANHNFDDIEGTYKERYMPTEDEIVKRFVKMHSEDFGEKKAKKMAKEMIANLEEIEEKVVEDILGDLKIELPQLVEGRDSYGLLLQNVKDGLRKRGKYKKSYIERCKQELEVIKFHGFSDYFLIVADYVNWAKDQGIIVGPGRGSVCNSLVAYALGITDVDSLLFDLDFRRFLRKDKKKFPDIDLDFETSRRHEVIKYLVNKYKGHAAQICSYGLYKVDNLVNDLAKKCGLDTTGKDIDSATKEKRKKEIADIKKLLNTYIDDGILNEESLMNHDMAKRFDRKYDNIITHFCKLFKKVRFIGTHAAGVAITGGNLLDYVALKIDKDGNLFTNYDLSDLENVQVIKFDILGLKTMESIGELRRMTGHTSFDENLIYDEKILEAFGTGKTDGIFQFEKRTARDILMNIEADCFADVVAASAMNRPGPLSMNMPENYAENKKNIDNMEKDEFYELTKETYGTIVYQEQLQQICVHIGKMSWGDADKVMKMLKGSNMTERGLRELHENKVKLTKEFVKGCKENGISESKSKEMFEKMLVYSFNKGHALGYTIISFEEMYYKIYYPNEYWYVKMKYAKDDNEVYKFSISAVSDGGVVFLPHVNYSSKTSMRKFEGENVIQLGMSTIKGIGLKAAEFIEQERKNGGPFKSEEDFIERCKNRSVTSRVIDILKEQGALEFNKKIYIRRVIKYNSTLLSRVKQ